MRKVLEINAEDITPLAEAVLQGQGVPPGSKVNNRTSDITREALSRFQVLSRPLGLTMEVSREQFQPVFRGEGKNAPSTPLEDIYPDAHSLVLFAVTLGESLCNEISRLFDTNEYALGSMLDAAASEGAELLANEVEKCFRQYLLKSGRLDTNDAVMQFSPGYCGWHISAQRKLFEALNPGEIGITLNDSFLMQPLKSISGVIIAGPKEIFEFEDSFDFCSECRTRSCLERLQALKKQ